MNIIIVGCGDIGLRVARLLTPVCNCYGFIRNPARQEILLQHNVTPVVFDLDYLPAKVPAILTNKVDEACGIFYFAPPGQSDSTDLRLANFIQGLRSPPLFFVYISTSGVYGDYQGAWVNEDSVIHPLTARAKRRASAEQQLLLWRRQTAANVIILRVPGIYGPQRLPLKRLADGEPVIRTDESPYTNMIHADDLANICLAARQRGVGGNIYNVSDGSPIKSSEYYLLLARLAGLPAPPQISRAQAKSQFDDNRWSFLAESRRLDISKMRRQLQPDINYANLEEGIRASLDFETG